MDDMEMTISMKCSICGNDQFSTVDEHIEDMENAPDETEVRCSDCGRIVTKAQLIEENSGLIDVNVEDFKEDIVKKLQKEIDKMFK
ncbi:MAG: ECs_2282 family putative zinc-binding protein [Saccharofermentanales bacterium]